MPSALNAVASFEDVDALDAGLGRVADRVARGRAAVREQREVARVVAALDRRAAQQVGHVRVHDPVHARGGLLDRLAEPLGERLERAHRGVAVERHRPAEEVVGVEIAEDQVRVGDGRQRAAAAVARRPRARARGRRPDLEHADRVDPRDRAAAGADALDRDLRDLELVLRDDRLVLELERRRRSPARRRTRCRRRRCRGCSARRRRGRRTASRASRRPGRSRAG